jgi:two-component system, cell cycle sensor histidine kinase and response regulator CckA
VQQAKVLRIGKGGTLVVDDEPAVLEVTSELLKRLGYKVHKAETGLDALGAYREKQDCINLVILDMILRGESGANFLKMLQGVNPDVRVILSSGYALQGEVQNVMEMGCLGFIQKPYDFSDLSNLIHKAMNE